MTPKSFSQYLLPLTRTNQIVLDATDHYSTVCEGFLYHNPNPVSYFRNCQDIVQGLDRQPRDQIDWHQIYYIDFKLTEYTHSQQIGDLQRILSNGQPLHVLHLVFDHVPAQAVVDVINTVKIHTDIVLDLHSIRAVETMALQDQVLALIDVSRFLSVDYHYIFNDHEAVYMHRSGSQCLEFYDPRANRGPSGGVSYSHMLRK